MKVNLGRSHQAGMANGKTTIVRHPTIPMSKRDSLSSSRVSVSSNNSHGGRGATVGPKERPPQKNWREEDFVGLHPSTVAGKPRSGKKAKRTDSYRQATERKSLFDELAGNDAVDGRVDTNLEGRKKYNTLPIQPGATVSQPIGKIQGRRKRENGTSGKPKDSTFGRSESQKSGRYNPSPDTDDDQLSTQPDRKKKSAFTRVKERLTRTFRKDSERRGEGGSKRSNSSDDNNIGNITHRCEKCGQPYKILDNSRSNSGFFGTIRQSMRRKRSPHKLRPSCSCNTTQTRATLHGSTHNGGARGNIHNDDLTSTFLELTDPSLCTWGAARSIIPSLKLTGLRKCEPRGFSDHYGRDEADCPGLHSPDQLETDAPESPVTDLGSADMLHDKERRAEKTVASTLTRIADSIEEKRRETSSASEGERQSNFDPQALLLELREYADVLDEERFQRRAGEISIDIMPVIRGILRTRDYSGFQRVITQELASTMGWDQVAWYTYLIRTTRFLVGNRGVFTQHATRYFNSTIRPFIQSRPNGWESVYDDTDVD